MNPLIDVLIDFWWLTLPVGLIAVCFTVNMVVIAPIRRWWTRKAHARAVDDGYALPFDTGAQLLDIIIGDDSTKSRNVGIAEKFGNCLSISQTGSALLLGATGSGKTEAGKVLIRQMNADEDEPVVVYDHKDDYRRYFEEYESDRDIIRISSENSTDYWNLFREVDDEDGFDEISRAMFPQTSNGGSKFFDTAARQLFTAVLKYLYRELDPSEQHNKALINFFKRCDRVEMYERLSEHDDLMAAASAIDPEADRQAAGVFATLQQKVQDVFVGDFAEAGDFSVREYMNNPQGRVLLLDNPIRQSEQVRPVFRFLVDHSAMHALDDSSRWSYFVLDEFARIDGLRRIGELVNVGRGQKVQLLISLQSVSQLYDNYGRDRGNAILSGLVTSIILRLQDAESIEYARTVIGSEFNEYTKHESRDEEGTVTETETTTEEEHSFAKGEFTEFEPGHGVVVRRNSWAYGYIAALDRPGAKPLLNVVNE